MTSRQGTSAARAFNRIYREAKARKTLLLVLSCFVVFVTTYALILPAITLDQEEAQRQGGIDVTAEQQADVTVEDGGVQKGSETTESVENPKELAASEDTALTDKITFEGKGYKVQADCADADLPGDTEIVAEEIEKKDKDYEALYADALEALQQDSKSNITGLAFAKFYDISLMSDGESIEPDTPINVTISYDKALKASDADNLHIVHFAVDSEKGEVTPEVLADDQVSAKIKSDKMTAATFETASFSVFAVVYTVDFEYDVDGQKYTYSIEGGSSISLADLLQQLHVIKDDPDTEPNEAELFMEDIEKVEFSSPDLVRVEQDEKGEWTLTSLQPFTSEETLTVTMENGAVFTVKVTDDQITSYDDIGTSGHYVIYVDQVVNNEHRYYALRNDGASIRVPNNDLGALGDEFIWRYNLDGTSCWWYSGSNYIDIDLDNPVIVGNTWRYSWTREDGNGGFDIVGYLYGNRHLSWDEQNGFKITSEHDVSIRIFEQKAYTYRVETSNASWGTIGHDEQTGLTDFNLEADGNGKNKNTLTASAKDNCKFKYWQLDSEIVSREPTIAIGELELTKDNMLLKAVFGKEYSSETTQQISEWIDMLTGNPITAEKTAHVYDYDNRIYEIDFSAASGRYTVEPDITIEFLTDASRSMFFPATLLQPDGLGHNASIVYESWEYDWWENKPRLNLQKWLNENGDTGTTYYVITDIEEGSKMSATMYAVYHDGSKWVYVDASYYEAPDGKTGSVRNVSDINDGYMVSNNGSSNHLMTGEIYVASDKVEGQEWNRLDYLKAAITAAGDALFELDPGAKVGLVTFNKQAYDQGRFGSSPQEREDFITAVGAIQLSGGTNQTSAINLYVKDENAPLKDVFKVDSPRKQVAVLITDGAPNGTTWTDISNRANQLKAKNVELYTLGLSLDNVGNNKENLNGIATDASHAYNAEQGDEFAQQIENIIMSMLTKATLYGDVSDTIDPAFYPVDQNGQPIEAGYYYSDTNGGQVTKHDAAPADESKDYYKWINNDGTWTVEWHNQEIKWPEDGGWDQKIYIKAKEDFFGGNTINTNVGNSNKVSSSKIKHDSSDDGVYYLNEDHSPFERVFETPYVNVDELTLNENSTEWRVYLGTDVDPKKELRALWEKIRVNQVVAKNGTANQGTTVQDSGKMFYGLDTSGQDTPAPDGNSNETLPLSHFVNGDLIDGLLLQLENNKTTDSASLTYRYFPYGHDILGSFTITLEKEVNTEAAGDNAPNKHETKEVGEDKEVYTLTVTYNPAQKDASETYDKTTPGHSAGKVADGFDGTTGERIQSENEHKIHVFAKDLEITKQDMSGNNIDTAKFKLYRTAREENETGNVTQIEVDSSTVNVVQIGNEMSTSGGKITVDDFPASPDGTYYLVETEAPAGYDKLTSPVEMHLYLDSAYTHYLPPKSTVTKAFTEENPYNWTQTVSRFMYGESEVGTGDNNKFVMTVKNNPGVVLPEAGGPGTTWIYLIGSLLLIGCGIALVTRRRMRI